jgi:hypothetical protein
MRELPSHERILPSQDTVLPLTEAEKELARKADYFARYDYGAVDLQGGEHY